MAELEEFMIKVETNDTKEQYTLTKEELKEIKYALEYLHDADLCEYGAENIRTLESVMAKLNIYFVSQLEE